MVCPWSFREDSIEGCIEKQHPMVVISGYARVWPDTRAPCSRGLQDLFLGVVVR